MQEKQENEFDINSLQLFHYIALKRKLLLIVTLLAIIISTAVSFLITPKFKASVILFPTASTSVSNSLLNQNLPKKEILTFGKEEEVEQMLQVLQSNEIRDRIVKKYDLFHHFNIDKNDPYKMTELDEEYRDNVTFRRTQYLSIEVEVLDQNPQLAANIANDIASFLDTVINNMTRERAEMALKLVEKDYFSLKIHSKVLEDSMKVLQNKGVYHYESQSEVLNQALGNALKDQKMKGAELIEEKLKPLAEYGSAYMAVRNLLVYEAEKMSILESRYSEAKMDAEQKLPQKYVVNKASKPEKRAYPVRWIIITICTLSAFILALIILLLMDSLKKNIDLRADAEPVKQIIIYGYNSLDNINLFNYDGMEAIFNNKQIFNAINKWKKHLIIVALASIAIGAFISSPLVIKPKYKSVTILYPVNLPTLSEESKTEQMLQIIQSMDIKKRLFSALDLGKHYGLDSTYTYYMSTLINEFEQNVTFSKTEFEGVEIEALDIDPQMACTIIDSIIKFYNDKVEMLHKKKNFEMVIIRGQELKKKRAEIDSLDAKQKELRTKYGVIDYDSQAKELTRGYVNMLNSGKKNKEVDSLMKNFKEKGGEQVILKSLAWAAQDQLRYIKDDYEKNLTEVNKKITYSLIVSAPIASDQKAYPVRWIIVFLTVFSALLLAIIIIAFIESKKRNAELPEKSDQQG